MKSEISEIQRLNEHLSRQAEQARKRAKKLRPGHERDALLKKARRAEITKSPTDGFPRPNCSRRAKYRSGSETRAVSLMA